MAREYDDLVTSFLETNGGVDDKSFGTANPQVWM